MSFTNISLIILIWAFTALCSAFSVREVAIKKGYEDSIVPWFLYGLLLCPIALLTVIALPDKNVVEYLRRIASSRGDQRSSWGDIKPNISNTPAEKKEEHVFEETTYFPEPKDKPASKKPSKGATMEYWVSSNAPAKSPAQQMQDLTKKTVIELVIIFILLALICILAPKVAETIRTQGITLGL